MNCRSLCIPIVCRFTISCRHSCISINLRYHSHFLLPFNNRHRNEETVMNSKMFHLLPWFNFGRSIKTSFSSLIVRSLLDKHKYSNKTKRRSFKAPRFMETLRLLSVQLNQQWKGHEDALTLLTVFTVKHLSVHGRLLSH